MTHQDKINTLMVAINNNIVLPECQKRVIASALVEGFIKIMVVEDAEKKAAQPYEYFPVELLAEEGFAMWNSGGFNTVKNRGEARLCAGIDGRHTKVLRTANEANGRHLLTLVYQGCYVLSAEARDLVSSSIVRGYQIQGFSNGKDGHYLARCRKVFNGPSDLLEWPEEISQRLLGLVEICGNMAGSVNLRRMEWNQ